jgi:hypothetical protein
MDLERFYDECAEILSGIGQLHPEDQDEQYAAITNRATEHKQTLINLRKDLLPLEGGAQQMNPQKLLEGDNTYRPLYIDADEPPRATIVSFHSTLRSRILY